MEDKQLEAIIDGLINAILSGYTDIEPIYLRCAYRLTVINAADPFTGDPAIWEE